MITEGSLSLTTLTSSSYIYLDEAALYYSLGNKLCNIPHVMGFVTGEEPWDVVELSYQFEYERS